MHCGMGAEVEVIQDGGERQTEDRACGRKALNEVFNRKFFVSVFFYIETNVVLKLSVYSVHSLKVAELQTAVDKVSYEFRQGGGL